MSIELDRRAHARPDSLARATRFARSPAGCRIFIVLAGSGIRKSPVSGRWNTAGAFNSRKFHYSLSVCGGLRGNRAIERRVKF